MRSCVHVYACSYALACITRTSPHPHSLHTPRSQAKAAIAYRYDDDSDSDDSQAKRDEQLLASYLGEDVEKEKAFSSESEYGR